MKYKLIEGSTNNYKSVTIKEDILIARGIENPKLYLNLNNEVEIHYSKLNNMDKAVECFISHAENNDDIYIQVDNDTDGMTSAAILYKYIRRVYPNLQIFWDMQEGKGHGIDIKQIPKGVKLVIIPDAGSNQYSEHKQLRDMRIDIIVLDHHKAKYESKDAIIVNNQLSEGYPNKQLSGVGIVYKFLQALDTELWIFYADEYLDLVALGNVADMMDLKSLETRYYINKGLNNIKSKFFRQLLEKQEFSTKGKATPHTIGFYISPLINALIRFGSQDDKKLVFGAFIDSDKTFKYTPRKSKDNPNPKEILENIYEHATRICISAKGKQDRYKTKVVEDLKNKLCINDKLNNNKIIIMDIGDSIVKNATGLIANQLAGDMLKPCILVREKNGIYRGSIRGTEYGELQDFKGFLESLKLCDWVEGHSNAAGIQFKATNFEKLINESNKRLRDVDFEIKYLDYIIPLESLTDDLIEDINSMEYLWGQGLRESLIKIECVNINTSDINLVGKKHDTLMFEVEDIVFVKFNCSSSEYDKLIGCDDGWGSNKEKTVLNVIGKCNVNIYENKKKLQIIIEDYEIIE